MPIPFSKYVAITSSVGGVAQASARELILRLITTNPLVPSGSVVEFDSVAAVAAYFDLGAVEAVESDQAQF